MDNDCDGTIDMDADADNDGVTTCSGDCNDARADVNPNVDELCNGIDDIGVNIVPTTTALPSACGTTELENV